MNSLCSHIKGQRRQWPAFCILQGLAVSPNWNLGCSVPGVGSPAVGSATHSSNGVSLLGAAGRRSWGETWNTSFLSVLQGSMDLLTPPSKISSLQNCELFKVLSLG